MIPLWIVEGPTASGKTALAVKIAKIFDGEVISADSMQIYKYMEIGSAQPSEKEKNGVPHHLMGIIEPTQNFSLSDYVKTAHKTIAEVAARGKLPVLCGGTGLYIDTVINNIKLSEEKMNTQTRERLERFAKECGSGALHDKLREIDPKSAENIHPNNVKRVIRAIEIYENSGITMSEQIENSRNTEKLYDTKEFGVWYERPELFSRIDRRVDKMIEAGLLREVENLINIGVERKNTSMQGIGYKELLDYFEKKCTFEEAVEKIKQESRRYAKRQVTWFKRHNIKWLTPAQAANFTEESIYLT